MQEVRDIAKAEADKLNATYRRRDESGANKRYSPFLPSVYKSRFEREAAIIELMRKNGFDRPHEKRALEIGCGAGSNLQLLVQLGFKPENLVGIELLEERVYACRHVLPESTTVLHGDAISAQMNGADYDLIVQSTVFSSILNSALRRTLAQRMLTLLGPDGAILWHDFTYDNPKNPDVTGISISEVKSLFPKCRVQVRRITLAPPINRRLTNFNPTLYGLVNTCFPFLRTHVLCWITKL